MSDNNVIKIVGVIIILIIIILIDLHNLFKASYLTKAILVYFSLIAINLIISTLLISGVEIISPAMVIEKIVRLFVPGQRVE